MYCCNLSEHSLNTIKLIEDPCSCVQLSHLPWTTAVSGPHSRTHTTSLFDPGLHHFTFMAISIFGYWHHQSWNGFFQGGPNIKGDMMTMCHVICGPVDTFKCYIRLTKSHCLSISLSTEQIHVWFYICYSTLPWNSLGIVIRFFKPLQHAIVILILDCQLWYLFKWGISTSMALIWPLWGIIVFHVEWKFDSHLEMLILELSHYPLMITGLRSLRNHYLWKRLKLESIPKGRTGYVW